MQNYNMVGTKVLLGNREHKNDFGGTGEHANHYRGIWNRYPLPAWERLIIIYNGLFAVSGKNSLIICYVFEKREGNPLQKMINDF